MHKLRSLIFFLGVALVGVGLVARDAHAYPQWQFVSGASRCTQCHYSPAGGGLINGYGRSAAGDDMSTFGGSGDFLHGLVELPKWLALGGDFRGAVLSHDNGGPEGAERAIFPMQADLTGRLAFGDWSLQGTVGYRGQARSDVTVEDNNFLPRPGSRFISREHWVLWRPGSKGFYARAGRFFAPFGLRLAEHYAYVRRDLGFNLLYETYGVAGGYIVDEWEFHATLFAPDFSEHNTKDAGAAVMYERRFDDKASLGFQGRAAFQSGFSKYTGGLFGKLWLEPIKTLFMAEGNVIFNQTAGETVPQVVAFFAPTVVPFKGLMIMPFVERNQTSVYLEKTATNAGGGQVSWFPYAHIELVLLGRVQKASGQEAAQTGMFFLHYYL